MTQFQKGASGNPKGRPVGFTIMTANQNRLKKITPKLFTQLLDAAEKGDVIASAALLLLPQAMKESESHAAV